VSTAIVYRKHAITGEIVYSSDFVMGGGHTAPTFIRANFWTWSADHVWPDVAFSL
jgi:hypothetical protein